VTRVRFPKSILAAAMLASAIALAGCETQDIDQTMPPYASISDEGRDPASAPKPAASSDDSGGFMNALGSVLMFPVRMIEAL
jgi:hypothetical protein